MKRALKLIDFRSDTVTKPSAKMLEAMFNAEVADDVYGEDPTVNRLQSRCAQMFGKEAGLFVASGTMGNLISLLTHCSRGESAIIGDRSHINLYEQGGMSALGGIFPTTVPNQEDGTLRINDILSKIAPENVHFSRVKLVALENTQNICGGRPLSVEYMRDIVNLKEKHGLKLHIDGARILNAFYALRETNNQLRTEDLAIGADSLNMCFSKGLRCPVGSILLGSEVFIKNALRWRKAVGGGMRQVGYLAAAALEALDTAEEIVSSDHSKARRLAKGLKVLGCTLNTPASNIIFFAPPQKFALSEFLAHIKERGILANIGYSRDAIRFIPNSGNSNEDIDRALEIISQVISLKSS